MSNFQLGLIIAGGVVLAAIVAFNAWSAHRNAPKRAKPPEPDGAAEPALRQEPAFDATGAPVEGPDVPGTGADPSFDGHTVDLRDAMQLPVPPSERRGGLDPLIDAIAPLVAEQIVSGDAALAALPPTRRAGSKAFAIEGFNESTQQWETPVAGQRYTHFQAGVQLANRVGALNEIEFSEFVVKAQGFADAINAAADFPDMLHEVARARELDQFAGDHDAQLAFVLRARQAAWSPGYVQQNAVRLGFTAGAIPGRLVLPASGPGLPPVLTLAYDTQFALSDDPEQSAIRDITLSLDVAQVHRSEQPFARLREVAAALGEAMDGALCDQNGTPLPAMTMDPIAADLELLYDKLDSRELSAGSLLARRLFS
ncbi:cell division protein FtsZ [Acidovorax sp. NCPPB 3576]|uniref:cell division protein FtsZ n=1 Tax=Acidovorax sp. NCPPB 3576 TaxID=2940488 RepID=UPI00234A569A|nr:cell division protein FtsZ [Acidovorax sp. NCPPB 3576]WCM90435.1 cell division protein FtsZ [Acidovorax sp. NCPPB 3576]